MYTFVVRSEVTFLGNKKRMIESVYSNGENEPMQSTTIINIVNDGAIKEDEYAMVDAVVTPTAETVPTWDVWLGRFSFLSGMVFVAYKIIRKVQATIQ